LCFALLYLTTTATTTAAVVKEEKNWTEKKLTGKRKNKGYAPIGFSLSSWKHFLYPSSKAVFKQYHFVGIISLSLSSLLQRLRMHIGISLKTCSNLLLEALVFVLNDRTETRKKTRNPECDIAKSTADRIWKRLDDFN
jgi:hypothetical protein